MPQAILIGAAHPLAEPLSVTLRDGAIVPYAAPSEPPRAEALVLLPDPWQRDPDDVSAVLDDLEVAYRWLHGWVPYVRDHGGGALLYVLDFDGIYGSADRPLLAERDSALLSQARSMALELGRMAVRANVLVLGPLTAVRPHRNDERRGTNAPDDGLAANPLCRVGTWDEAAAVGAFLLGAAAVHLSGQVLVCAGGADVGRAPA